MRDPEVSIHAYDLRAGFVSRLAANELGKKIQQIVKDHESKGERNQGQISPADPLHHGMRRANCNSHVNRSDDESFARTGVTGSASFWKVRGIHRGARVGRTEDVVHSMAGSTVGHALGSAAHGEAVITVGERRNPVGGQVVAQGQALIAVAAPAGGHGDAGRIHQRCRLFRRQDEVLTVTIAADRGAGHAVLHGLSVHTFQIGLRNVGMALRAGRRNIKVVYLGARVLRGKDSVASVAVGAGRGRSVAIHDGSSMHALLVEFDGMREWNLVPRKKLLVAVAGGAGVRKIFLGDCREPWRLKFESGGWAHDTRRRSARRDRQPRLLVRGCFAGTPSLRRRDIARTLPAPSAPPPSTSWWLPWQDSQAHPLARYARCSARGKLHHRGRLRIEPSPPSPGADSP
jgi:hypothetical protein